MHKRFKILLGAVAMVVLPVLSALSPMLVQDAHAAELKIIMEDGWGSNDITAGYNPLVSDTGHWGSYKNLNFTVKVDGVTGKSISVTADKSDAVTISKTSTGFDLKVNDNPSVSKRYINITVKVHDPALEYTFYIAQEATGFGTGCPYSACLVENGNYIPASIDSPVYTFGSAGGSRTYDKIGHFDDIYNDPSSPCKISITSQTDTRITITAIKNTSNGDCTAGLSAAGAPPLYTFTQPRYFDDDGTATPTDPDDPNNPDGNTDNTSSDCDAGKFGWALCPIMEGIDQALDGLYGFIESNFLQVDIAFYRISADFNADGTCPSGTSLKGNTCQGDTYRYWQTFRNIANIIFVIIFMIIILSQVTSVGISNYGIKKMLPEIIIAALLINLSYFICQALVDVSNIVGVSIRDFLGFIVDGSAPAALEGAEGSQSFLNTVAVLAGASAAGFTVVTILSQGVFGLIAAILVVLLTALVAIFMMFVILVVRQIAVILLIVLAPLAFAARILPNTANLFKNWWKAFSSLLVVYPICSLVIGLGAAAATILGSQIGDISTGDPNTQSSLLTNLAFIGSSIVSGNFNQLAKIEIAQGIWIAATVLAMVVPYFAVIPLCKAALNGLGKLGGMITGGVTGAGASLNRLGNKGINAGAKKFDQKTGFEAARQARLSRAKLKIEEKNKFRTAEGKGQFGKLRDAEIKSAQAGQAAALASVGQYDDDGSGSKENKRLMKISAKKAKELGVDPQTGLAIRAPKNAAERELQARAKTARNQADAAQAKEIDEGFAGRSAESVYEEVYDATADDGKGGFRDNIDRIAAKQAINNMAAKGEWNKVSALSQAYSKRWGSGDSAEAARARGQLGEILQGNDTKSQSFAHNAYGKAITEKGYTGAFEDFIKDKSDKGLLAAINKPGQKYRKSFGTMHGEALAELAQYDQDGEIRRAMAGQMDIHSVGEMGQDNLRTFTRDLKNVDGTDLSAAEAFSHVAEAYEAAGVNAATLGYTQQMQSDLGIRSSQGSNVLNPASDTPITQPAPQTLRRDNVSGGTITDSGIILPPGVNPTPPAPTPRPTPTTPPAPRPIISQPPRPTPSQPPRPTPPPHNPA